MVEVSNDSVFQVITNDDRFKALTHLVSPFSEDNNFIRIVVIPYNKQGFTIKAGEPIGTSKEIENQDIIEHENTVKLMNSILISLWTDDETPPKFLDRKKFEETVNELRQINDELKTIEKQLTEARHQIYLSNVEEAQLRQEYKQKRKEESKKMEEEKKRFGEIRKAQGLKQHEMEEKRRIENLEKKQRERMMLAKNIDIKEEFECGNDETNIETRKKFIEELIKKSEQELETLEERELILKRKQRNLLLKM